MSNVAGQCQPSINFTQTPAAGFLSGQALPINLTLAALFKASGVLADQVDTIYANTLTFTASTPQTLDLTTLTDILGNAISFARVRFLAIRVQSVTDGQYLLVGDAVTTEWDGFLSAAGTLKVFASSPTSAGAINNSGFTLLCAPNTTGIAVTGSSKSLKLDPGTFAFKVDIVIAGCSV